MNSKLYLLLLLLCACSADPSSIKIKGSDTEVNLTVNMAEHFYQSHPDLSVSVSGGGSGLGIASLLNDNTHIANSSRAMKPKERAHFDKMNVKVSSFIFAQDAVAFVVSEKLPLDSISTDDLGKILSGEWTKWKEICDSDLPINVYGRQSSSGTFEYIKKNLKIDFAPNAKQMNGNAQILEAIKSDASGIGYVGVGYVLGGAHKGLKVLKISSKGGEAVSPLEIEKVIAGKYYFKRPLYQFYRTKDAARVKPFLDYELSKEGKALIQAAGYFPTHISS